MPREGSLDLLQEVEESLEIMKETQQVKPVKVKSMLEHLRSALEYVANDVYDTYHPQETVRRPKVYFPFGKKIFIDNFFSKTIGIAISSESPLQNIFHSIQEYRNEDKWLAMMCALTNEVKHRKPLPLKEEEVTTGGVISAMGCVLFQVDTESKITVKNLTVNGTKLSDFTYNKGQLENTDGSPSVNLALTKEKKIKFHGEDYEVIPFIEKCLHEIRPFINNAYDFLDNVH